MCMSCKVIIKHLSKSLFCSNVPLLFAVDVGENVKEFLHKGHFLHSDRIVASLGFWKMYVLVLTLVLNNSLAKYIPCS